MDRFGNEQLHATPLRNVTISRVNGVQGEPVAAVLNVGNLSFAYVYPPLASW